MEHLLWTEKYRPQTIEDCILPERLKQPFQEYVNQQNIPNLLLSGGAGVGKGVGTIAGVTGAAGACAAVASVGASGAADALLAGLPLISALGSQSLFFLASASFWSAPRVCPLFINGSGTLVT